MYTTKLKKVFIGFLLGIMVFSSFSFSSSVSAATVDNVAPAPVVVVSGEAKVVTVSFSVYAAQVNTLEALKNSITVQRTGALAYSALGTNDTIAFTNTLSTATLVVTFESALTGKTNSIKIAAGAIMNSSNLPYSNIITMDNIVGLDITAPAYVGSSTATNNEGGNVSLYFDENFSINSSVNIEETDAAHLRSHMSIATDGVNFVPFPEKSYLYKYGSSLYIGYTNQMQVILGNKTRIKIAKDMIEDAAGNLNDEMILQITPPVIEKVEISADYHDVTVTYNTSIFDNTGGSLAGNIYLIRDSDGIPLNESDTASIIDGKLHIHFAKAVSGSNNQIFIRAESIKDSLGNVTGDGRMTGVFQANIIGDNTAPKLIKYYVGNSNQDLILVFDENVLNATSDANFKASVVKQYYYGTTNLSNTELTFSGKTVTIHFPAALDTYYDYHHFNFPSNLFKDAADNVLLNSIDFNVYPGTSFSLSPRQSDKYISHDGRWMSLAFQNNINNLILMDTTIVDGVSHLKEAITISLDHGATFSALDSLDVVSIKDNRLVVLFHDGKKSGSVQVKIKAGALSDLGNNVQNSAIDVLIAYNTPDITGYILSDTASEFVFADNEAWRSKVRDIYIADYINEGTRSQLSSSDYTITAGKLTLNSGLFQEGHGYEIIVNADGYSSKTFGGTAHKSSEIFYMTAPTVTTVNGITASINLFNNVANDHATTGTQTVIFQLMNGSTPVSIAASDLRVSTGAYTANFNAIVDTTNPNPYTVRAFVVSQYNNDPANVGLNLATVKTQSELDLLIMAESSNQNDAP